MPSNSTTLPLPPNSLANCSPAIFPPATLSEAMWETIVPPAAARSTVNTGMPAALAFSIEGTTASASVGLISKASTFLEIRSSRLAASLAGSFSQSTMTSLTPTTAAAFSAPSLRVTKKGLSNVEMDRPRVSSLGAGVGTGVGVGAGFGAHPLRIRTPIITAHSHRTSKRFIVISSLNVSFSLAGM